MTKYVLNSGGIRNEPERKKKFHLEIIKGLGKNPKVVMCNFAQGREYWEPKFQGYCDSFAEDMPDGVKPSFKMAMPADFAERCQWADVIYFMGGDDHLLQYWMKQYDLKKLFKDKVVATNSASSDMLVKHFWTNDWRHCADGFGILPIKFIPHFKSDFGSADPRGPVDWDDAYKKLEAYGDTSLPIHALEEGEFIVMRSP
jgi:hypothetical protein